MKTLQICICNGAAMRLQQRTKVRKLICYRHKEISIIRLAKVGSDLMYAQTMPHSKMKYPPHAQ